MKPIKERLKRLKERRDPKGIDDWSWLDKKIDTIKKKAKKA